MIRMLTSEDVVEAIELLRSRVRAEDASGWVFAGGDEVADALGFVQHWVARTKPGCLPTLVVLDEQSVTVALAPEAQPYWQELLGWRGAMSTPTP